LRRQAADPLDSTPKSWHCAAFRHASRTVNRTRESAEFVFQRGLELEETGAPSSSHRGLERVLELKSQRAGALVNLAPIFPTASAGSNGAEKY